MDSKTEKVLIGVHKLLRSGVGLLLSPLLINPPVFGEQGTFELAPFHVSAYWIIDTLSDYAGSATLLDANDIREAGAANLGEILESQAGVVMRSSSGNPASAQVDLRGFGENSGLRTLILVDGMPLNRPDMGTPSWLEIPVGQIERVEVLRGSHTARYGSQAMGGVINITTRLGSKLERPQTSIETTAGDNGTFIGRISHYRQWSGMQTSSTFEHNRSNGYRDHSGFESTALQMNAGGTYKADWHWRAGMRGLINEMEFPGPLTTVRYHDNPRQSFYKEFDQHHDHFSKNKHAGAHFSLRREMGPDSDLRARGAYTFRDSQWNMGRGSHTNNTVHSWRLSPEWSYHDRSGNWVVGADAHRDQLDIEQFRDRQRQSPRGEGDLSRTLLAAFVQRQQNWSERWQSNLGLRGENITVDAQAADFINPANQTINFQESLSDDGWALDANLLFHPRRDLKSWLRYNRSYRFPVTDEIAAYQGFPLSEPFNASLSAETGDNVEIGILHEKGHYSVRLNLFAMWLDGEIHYDYERNLNINGRPTRRLGAEWSVYYRGEKFDGTLFYTIQESRYWQGEYRGNRVPLVAEHRLTIISRYRLSDAIALQGEYTWSSSAPEGNDYENTRTSLPSWQVVNAMVSYQANAQCRIYLRIQNLFDEKYATLKFSSLWYPAPGRHYRAGIQYHF